jgi:NitT/TauT family transport system permease protein
MRSTPPSDSRKGAGPWARRPGRLLAAATSLVLFILAWKLAAALVGHDLLLPPPEKVLGEALALYPTPRFLAALGATFLRGGLAFLISLIAGAVAGIAAGLSPLFDAVLSPVLTVIRATPVLALILIAYLWFPLEALPVFSAILMCFPVMVTSAAAGARAADPRLLEMARLFKVPRREQLLHLRLPQAAPFLLSGAKSALGLSWKVVVSGEVLVQPLRALGTGLQNAHFNWETGQVLAWAAAAVLLCGLTEWIFGLATKAALRHGL